MFFFRVWWNVFAPKWNPRKMHGEVNYYCLLRGFISLALLCHKYVSCYQIMFMVADTLKLIDCLIQCHNIRCLWPSKYEHDSHMLCEVLVMPVYPHYVMVKEGSWPFYGSVYHTRDRESYSMSRPFVRALWHNMMYSVRQHTIQGSSPHWTL